MFFVFENMTMPHIFGTASTRTIRDGIIWTNLAKIGVKRPSDETASINPFGQFLSAQKDLAVKTLQAEIEEYEPDLVVLITTGDRQFGPEIFERSGKCDQASVNGRSFGFMKRGHSHPAVLVVAHPSLKPRAERTAWVEKAGQLISGSRRARSIYFVVAASKLLG